MRKRSLVWLLTFVASAAPLDLSAWKYRKKIELTPGDGVAVVKLDKEVYAAVGSRNYKLRIYRDNEETPFIFTSPSPQVEDRVVSPNTELQDEVIVPGEGLQFVVRSAGRHDRIRLSTDLKNFRSRVRIETSDDAKRWAIARDDGAIFNFQQDGREMQSTTIPYPVSTKKFLRVTIFGWTKIGSVESTLIDYRIAPLPEQAEVFAKLTPQVWEDAAAKSTYVLIDLGQQGLPVHTLRLFTSSPQFQRAATVECSGDARNWTDCGNGTLPRLPGPQFTEESLTASAQGGSRYYRLQISNQDDKPIHVDAVQAEGAVNQLKFLASAPGDYWLYYDGPGLEPQYDLPAVLARQTLPEHPWTLGAQEANPLYRAPEPPKKPWSEQHPALLYTALGVAVAALGAATFRFASRMNRQA